jgi:hypothetical protein
MDGVNISPQKICTEEKDAVVVIMVEIPFAKSIHFEERKWL